MKPEIIRGISDFVSNLESANIRQIALLKRANGKFLHESKQAMGIFYKLLPKDLQNSFYEEIYFLIATLYGFNKIPFHGNFGLTMRKIFNHTNSKNIEKRLLRMLESNFNFTHNYYVSGGGLFNFLRNHVRLAKGSGIGIDWELLIKDLHYWTYPNKFVQKSWAKQFFIK